MMEPLGLELSFEKKMNEFREESVETYQEVFQANYGPMVTAREALGDGWAGLKADLDAFFADQNEADDGTVLIHGEYLEVVGRKA
jgi:hypothetical protein